MLVLLPGVILGAFGALLLGYGIKSKKKSAFLRKTCTEETEGTVTGYHTRGEIEILRGKRGRRRYMDSRADSPIYEYEADGRTYTVESESRDYKGKWRYEQGQKIAVRYAPGDPARYYIPGETKRNDTGVRNLVIFGGFLLVLAVAVTIKLLIDGPK